MSSADWADSRVKPENNTSLKSAWINYIDEKDRYLKQYHVVLKKQSREGWFKYAPSSFSGNQSRGSELVTALPSEAPNAPW